MYHRQNEEKINPTLIEQIKNDDPTMLSQLDFSSNQYSNITQTKIFELILENDAIKCCKVMISKGQRLYFTNYPKLSPKMTRLIYDSLITKEFCFRQSNYSLYRDIIKFKPNTSPSKPNSNQISQYVKNNDLPNLKLLIENSVFSAYEFYTSYSSYEMRNPSLNDKKLPECNKEIALYLVSHGFEINRHIIPAYMFRNNQVDLIKILQKEYGYILDFNELSGDDINKMVLNNSFEAIQMIIEAGIGKMFINSLLVSCATYNCEEVLDMIIANKDKLFVPKCGSTALKEACKLMRFSIAEKLLIPSILDEKTVKETMEIAKMMKNDDFYQKLEKILPECSKE